MRRLLPICLMISLFCFFSCKDNNEGIVYPNQGFYGQNILADNITEVRADYNSMEDSVFGSNVYSITAIAPKNSSVRIKIIDVEMVFYNFTYSYRNGQNAGVRFPVDDFQHIRRVDTTDGKIHSATFVRNGAEGIAWNGGKLDVAVGFASSYKQEKPYSFSVEFYENDSETPTMVKRIKVVE